MEYIVYTLAVWRVAYMLVEDIGPFDCFIKLRKATRDYDWINLDCIACISVVLSLPLLLLGFSLVECLAIAGGALITNAVYERLNSGV